jgi:protein-S-isoprenylcysteine O-methyltransferase Ste14
VGNVREPVLFLSGPHSKRPRPSGDYGGSVCRHRHPGYLAGIVVVVASGISLDSWLATLLLAVCTVPFLFGRAINEDRVLRAELPGYSAYAERVRWRLLPGVW